MTLSAPTEANEQAAFVQYLALIGLKYSALPLSTYTTSQKQKALNARMGVRAGVPDMMVIIPPERAKGGHGRLLFVEMKRTVGGTVSPHQKLWIEALNGIGDGVVAVVARGFDEARAATEQYLAH